MAESREKIGSYSLSLVSCLEIEFYRASENPGLVNFVSFPLKYGEDISIDVTSWYEGSA